MTDRMVDDGAEVWIKKLSKVPMNRRYVTAAKSAGAIESVPPAIDKISSTSISELDARVPHPSVLKLPDGTPSCGLIAYAYHVHCPESPPNPNFEDWDSYRDYVGGLKYLSDEWKFEHGKFLSASSMGKAAGLDPNETPEKSWSKMRDPNAPRKRSWFEEYILARGLRLEGFVTSLYRMLCEPGVRVDEFNSVVHKTETWIWVTPDGKVVDTKTGKVLRGIEIKNPKRRHAFHTIPPEHMMQIQFGMWAAGIPIWDFMSLEIDDITLESEFIVHRVRLSDAYIIAALPVLRAFCRAVLTGTTPPPRGSFSPPKVESEQIFRAKDVVAMVPNGTKIVTEAISMARSDASRIIAITSKPNLVTRDDTEDM